MWFFCPHMAFKTKKQLKFECLRCEDIDSVSVDSAESHRCRSRARGCPQRQPPWAPAAGGEGARPASEAPRPLASIFRLLQKQHLGKYRRCRAELVEEEPSEVPNP